MNLRTIGLSRMSGFIATISGTPTMNAATPATAHRRGTMDSAKTSGKPRTRRSLHVIRKPECAQHDKQGRGVRRSDEPLSTVEHETGCGKWNDKDKVPRRSIVGFKMPRHICAGPSRQPQRVQGDSHAHEDHDIEPVRRTGGCRDR